jgi:hypothetical protein
MKKPGVRFPDRREGRVHLCGDLRLDDGPARIEITFRREAFTALLERAPATEPRDAQVGRHLGELLTTIWVALLMPSRWSPARHGRPRLARRDTYADALPYAIYITPADLARCAQDPFATRRELFVLFSEPVLTRGLAQAPQPRGLHAISAKLLAPLRVALLEAEWLCKLAPVDATVRAHLAQRLGPEFAEADWRQNAIALATHAFAGAWEKHHVTPLDARAVGDAGDVYRVVLSRAHRDRAVAFLRKQPPDRRAWLHEVWQQRLLGPDGQAARDFNLI